MSRGRNKLPFAFIECHFKTQNVYVFSFLLLEFFSFLLLFFMIHRFPQAHDFPFILYPFLPPLFPLCYNTSATATSPSYCCFSVLWHCRYRWWWQKSYPVFKIYLAVPTMGELLSLKQFSEFRLVQPLDLVVEENLSHNSYQVKKSFCLVL